MVVNPFQIMLDGVTNDVVSTYGPRPSEATKLVNDFKNQHGSLTPEFKQDLQVWYNQDKGQGTFEDLTEMLCELQPNFCL